jgi:hypothetical protein
MFSDEQTDVAVLHPVSMSHGQLASNPNTIRHEIGVEGLSVVWPTARGAF